MLIMLVLAAVSWVYMYVKTQQTVHFKYVQLIVCQFYLSRESNGGKSGREKWENVSRDQTWRTTDPEGEKPSREDHGAKEVTLHSI